MGPAGDSRTRVSGFTGGLHGTTSKWHDQLPYPGADPTVRRLPTRGLEPTVGEYKRTFVFKLLSHTRTP